MYNPNNAQQNNQYQQQAAPQQGNGYANNGEQKQYTFLSLNRCVAQNGNNYVGITAIGPVVSPKQLRTVQGQNGDTSVLSFTMPIKNRERSLTTYLGGTPTLASDGETIWARVTCWGKTAERLDKLVRKSDKLTLTVVGSARLAQNEQYLNLEITCMDFDIKSMKNSDGNNGSNSFNQQNQYQQPQPQYQQQPAPQPAQNTAPAQNWNAPQQAPAQQTPPMPEEIPGLEYVDDIGDEGLPF